MPKNVGRCRYVVSTALPYIYIYLLLREFCGSVWSVKSLIVNQQEG